MKHRKYFKSRQIKSPNPNPTHWLAKQSWCSYLWSASEDCHLTTTSAAGCRGFMFPIGWQRQHIQTVNWTFWFHASIALKANPVYCLAARIHAGFLKKHTTGGKKRGGILMGLLWPDSKKKEKKRLGVFVGTGFGVGCCPVWLHRSKKLWMWHRLLIYRLMFRDNLLMWNSGEQL